LHRKGETVNTNPVEDFAAAARDYLLSCGQEPPPEFHWNTPKFVRYHVEGDRKGSKNGWYRGYFDDYPVLFFGSWKTGISETFRPDHTGHTPTPEERSEWKRKAEERNAQRRAEEEKAAKLAEKIIWQSNEAHSEHPYLKKKNVQPHGLLQISRTELKAVAPDLIIYRSGDLLVVPLQDTLGKLWSVQFITGAGEKLFLEGGRVEALYFPIGEIQDKGIICEGFASGATDHNATGQAIFCAMNAGNLPKVAKALKKKHPSVEFVIAADHDKPAKNSGIRTGEKYGKEAALAINARFAMPPEEGTDFNDLAATESLETVKKIIEGAGKASLVSGVGEVSERGHSEPGEWPEPEPLFRPLPPGEPFPLDALGEILGGGARAIAEIRRVPEGAAGQSVLSAASLAAQSHADVEIDGLRQPIGIFEVTILPSGEGKSVADSAAFAPAEKMQAHLMELYHAEEVPKYKRDLALWEEGKKLALRKKTHSERLAAMDEIGDAPVPPAPPILLATDPTYEGITRIFAEGWATLALANDEGGGFLGGWAMNPEQRLGTLARLSRLWDRGEVERLRASGAQGQFPGCRFTFHLMVQPHVSSDLLADPIACNQGFLARCHMAAPEPLPADARKYQARNVRDDPRYQTFFSRMLALLERPLPWSLDTRGQRNGLDPRVLKPNADARKIWIGLHDWVLQNIDADGPLAPVREAANKAAQQALRLAAILTLSNDPDATEIGAREMEGAAILARYYLSEALRLTGAAAINADLLLAERLLKWLREGGAVRLDDGRMVIWPVRIYQDGPSPLRAKADALRILGILESHGMIRPIEAGEAGGAKRNHLWEVRPDAE
jgi:putative DNA primase/helicase